MKNLDWIANGFGMIGTILMANKIMALGWGVLFLANCCFIAFGVNTKQKSFVWYNLAFGANSIWGFYRWI